MGQLKKTGSTYLHLIIIIQREMISFQTDCISSVIWMLSVIWIDTTLPLQLQGEQVCCCLLVIREGLKNEKSRHFPNIVKLRPHFDPSWPILMTCFLVVISINNIIYKMFSWYQTLWSCDPILIQAGYSHQRSVSSQQPHWVGLISFALNTPVDHQPLIIFTNPIWAV